MSFSIEQNREEARQAFTVQSQSDIKEIRLIEARAACTARWDQIESPVEFGIRYKPGTESVSEGKLLIPIRFDFKMRGPDKRDFVAISCRMEAEYELVAGFTPSPEEVGAFKAGNAVFNCWPYVREYVESTVTRMHFPPPTLPFLRMVPRREEQRKAIASEEHTEAPGEPLASRPASRKSPAGKKPARHNKFK